MLRQRVITALIMAVVGLSALFLLPPPAFALATALLLAGMGGWEAARLAGIDGRGLRLVVAALMLGICLGIELALPTTPWILLPAAAVWLLNILWLARPQLGSGTSAGWPAAKLVVLAIILPTAWMAVSWLQATSPWLVFMVLILIAAADTFAYFTGRYFGGPKLAPRISPGKTRSGAVGGLLGAMTMTAAAAAVLPDSPFGPLQAAALGLGLGAISIAGDLYISLLKRQRGLKDTSALLPGHGGVLDRFDSMVAALPFFTLAVMLWGQ
jgi:phosphatidate cytidylyltransferase